MCSLSSFKMTFSVNGETSFSQPKFKVNQRPKSNCTSENVTPNEYIHTKENVILYAYHSARILLQCVRRRSNKLQTTTTSI
jgi:hypothetical protein